MSDRTGLLARIRDLEASLAAAEAERDDIRQTLEEYLRKHQDAHRLLAAAERRAKEAEQGLSIAESDRDAFRHEARLEGLRCAGAERRLALAREALEGIVALADSWSSGEAKSQAREALTALDGEDAE